MQTPAQLLSPQTGGVSVSPARGSQHHPLPTGTPERLESDIPAGEPKPSASPRVGVQNTSACPLPGESGSAIGGLGTLHCTSPNGAVWVEMEPAPFERAF